MDHMMEDNEEAIKLKECPRCRTPIRRNLRYGAQINQCLAEIEKVKEKIGGPQSDIQTQREELNKQWLKNDAIRMSLPVEFCKIRASLENSQLTAKDVWVLENKISFLEQVDKLLQICKKQMSVKEKVHFDDRVEKFLEWLMDPHQKFTEQQISDLQGELQRLFLLAELNARCQIAMGASHTQLNLNNAQAEVTAIREVLDRPGPFTDLEEQWVRQALTDLKKKLPTTGLGISDEERKMIVSAMNLNKGHWYKCPNGHVYAIGDCGGAMVSRACPECDAIIGGQSHTLATGNSVASEMDGAQHAAWSEANNIGNFNLMNFN